MNRLGRSPGFSLIEISIVFSIIGIVSVVGFISLNNFQRDNAIYAETKKFSMAIAVMKQLAVEEGLPFRMYLSKTENKYSIKKYIEATDTTITFKEWRFENGISFGGIGSSYLFEGGNDYYFEVKAGNGLLNTTLCNTSDILILLKYGNRDDVKILLHPAGGTDIQWD